MDKRDCSGIPQSDVFFQTLQLQAREKAIPISGTFELTPRCNFNCKMCYVHLMPERIPQFGRERTAAEWIRIAKEAKEAGMLWLCITGGEPVLHPEFPLIYRSLAEMGFFITLQTNASTMSDEILRLLEEYPPQAVKTTIYGSNDQIYEDVCGIKKGFTRVDAGIRALLERGIPVQTVTTVIRQNMDDMENIYRYVQGLKLPWIYTAAVKPSIRGAETDAIGVAINEEMATDYRADVRRMMRHPVMKDGKKPCEYCKGYRVSFWVTWDGKMRFCSFMNEPNIPVEGGHFRQSWEELVAYEEALQWPAACQSCEVRHACKRCIGMLASFSGSAAAVDETYCKRFKTYYYEEKKRSV